MKTKTLLLTFIISTSILFDSCLKKGEDDPSISFKSRKARVVGDWKVVSYKYTSAWTNSGNTSTNVYVMSGSTYSETNTNTNPSSTTTTNGTHTIEFTFEKDGKYKSTAIEDGDISTESGTWNFTSGVGELKNKSQITTYGQSYTSTGGSSSYTGNYVDGAYDLKELRNKKMVWYYKYAYTGSSSNSSYEIEIEFEAK